MSINYQPKTVSEGTYIPDDLIIGGEIKTRTIVIPTGQTIKRGTVLGKITSGGKYIKSLSAASDGSQTPDLIAAEDVTTTGDYTTLAYEAGIFNASALDIGTAHTIASIQEGLRVKGIYMEVANATR
jgi:hypothetical protein